LGLNIDNFPIYSSASLAQFVFAVLRGMGVILKSRRRGMVFAVFKAPVDVVRTPPAQ
jgi:hypothetical protein